MTTRDPLVRLDELEQQLARLQDERADPVAQGAMLKALLNHIAKRRAVEEELRQAREWMHLAKEAGRVAAYTFDFTSGQLEWSPSTMSLYGFASNEEPTLERWLSSIHPEDRAAVSAVADASIKNGVDVDQRFRIVRPDGSISWVQDRAKIVLGLDGAPRRLVGINVDVTELVELQLRASEAEQRLRLALQAQRIGCWDWDLVSGAVTWDDSLPLMTGLEQEFGGSFDAFWSMVHEADRPIVKASLDAALAGTREYDLEFRMDRPDGGIRWTQTRAVVVRDAAGRPLRMVGVDADITDRKNAEAKARASDHCLETVLDASTDCIKVIELDGSISYMNRNRQCAMEVFDPVELVGTPWDRLWPVESAALVRDALDQARAGKTVTFEAFCPTAGGTPKWWEVSVAPIRDDGGVPIRLISVSRDISGRRAAADQLKLFNAELHHRLKNNLTTILALARSTLRSAPDLATFEQVFSDRLQALGETYALLRSGTDSALLADLVEMELKPFEAGAHAIHVGGPEILLRSESAVAFGMMLHELTTNSCKYGSLCASGGSLSVHWHTEAQGGDGELLVFDWLERGGPPVVAPNRTGFGSKLIDRLVRQLGGTLARSWAPAGLGARVTVPLRDSVRG